MKFYTLTSQDVVVRFIAGRLMQALDSGQRVLWLVPGGSSIPITASVSRSLAGHNLENLAVSLTDERFGPVGHPDSNWQQLQDAGFTLPGATMLPVLSGMDRDQTAIAYHGQIMHSLERAQYALGFFGIGPDGHTAGILPGSPAVADQNYACGYVGRDFQRLTITPKAIARLSEAVVYAVGQPKWPVIDQLEQDVPLETQPAQALKKVPELTVFNDHKGEAV